MDQEPVRSEANKRTAYEGAFGQVSSSPIVPFGEVVLFRMPSSVIGRSASKRQLKGDFAWEKGMFLGKTLSSDEFLIGTKQGVHTCRTVKRLTEELRSPKRMDQRDHRGALRHQDEHWEAATVSP